MPSIVPYLSIVIWLVVTGTWLLWLSHDIGKVIIPTDFIIFFRGVGGNHQPVLFNSHFFSIRIMRLTLSNLDSFCVLGPEIMTEPDTTRAATTATTTSFRPPALWPIAAGSTWVNYSHILWRPQVFFWGVSLQSTKFSGLWIKLCLNYRHILKVYKIFKNRKTLGLTSKK